MEIKSVMQSEKRCFVCGKAYDLERHHAISGWANRRLADKYGLTVWLCHDCHRSLHDKGKYDRELKEYAQTVFERVHGNRDDFRRIFGRSYL